METRTRREVVATSVGAWLAGLFASPTKAQNTSADKSQKAEKAPPLHEVPPLSLPEELTSKAPEFLESDAIKEGQTLPDRDIKAWNAIIERFKKNYSWFAEGDFDTVPEINYLTTGLNNRILEMDEGFVFEGIECDQLFLASHVETLLNQAADLLDRCLRDRLEWQDRAAKAATLSLEIQEFRRFDKIHEREIQAGIYVVPAKQSAADMKAQYELGIGAQNAANLVAALVSSQYTWSAINQHVIYAQLEAWLAHLANYEQPYVGNALVQTFHGVSKTAPDHMIDAAFDAAKLQVLHQYYGLRSERVLHNADVAVSKERQTGLAARAQWDSNDVGFKLERTTVARQLVDLKVRLATEPGGALNYAEQMEVIKQRFTRDFRDAMARLRAASEGLRTIYGYDDPLPAEIVTALAGGQVNRRYFDLALKWVRDAIACMIRLSQLDQNYSLAISIRELVGESGWKAGLASGTWTVNVPETLCRNQFCVRLRGLSAFVRDHNLKGAWRLEVKLPEESFFRHSDGTTDKVQQRDLPPSRLGRVVSTKSFREPEMTGLTAWRNAAPFGSWQVAINEHSTAREKRKVLHDVILELQLTVRSVR